MATLTVLRGAPSETPQQLAERLTRQSDQWASALNEAMRTIDAQAAKIKALEAREFALGALPKASSAYRGALWLVPGGTGVADTLHACTKGADESYAWHQIALP